MGSALELLTSATTHKVKQAEIDAKRTVQGAYNEKEAATASLSRYAQSINNQRKMDAAGQALAAQEANINSALDNSTTGTFASRLQAASELGAASVSAAAAGVGGGSVDAYRQVLSLNQAVNDQAQSSALRSDIINAKQQEGDTIRNAIASLDNEQFAGSFDYSQVLDHVKQKNVVGTAIAAGVATYFGGPQAGMAVTDAAAASNRYANGDRAGGNALLNSAIERGFSAYKGYSATSGASNSQLGGGVTTTKKSGFWSGLTESFTVK